MEATGGRLEGFAQDGVFDVYLSFWVKGHASILEYFQQYGVAEAKLVTRLLL